MKNKAAVAVGLSCAVVLILIIVLAHTILHHAEIFATWQAHIKKPAEKDYLLVVDFDNKGALNQEELLQGEDAVIAVKITKTDASAKEEFFNSLHALQNVDLNKDGVINKNDAIFPRMELMFFDKARQRRYVSFEEADIKAIQINQEFLKSPRFNELNLHNNIAGKAILGDGRAYTIRVMAVPAP